MSKTSLVVAGAVGGLFVWLFAPALTGTQSFSFRDASHYYNPLFEWTASQFAAGQGPWWNPHENLGVPLAAENTASLFYPGKLLFALPWHFTLRYNLYIVAHVVLAAGGAYYVPRRWGASPVGAGLSALSYAFGASVLFQTCNVIFLVGAAWLPWSLAAAGALVQKRSLHAAAAFGCVLALMVTGGDPQMAYNALLLAGLYALVVWQTERRGGRSAGPHGTSWFRRRPALLLVAGFIGLLLAAVQVLPSIEATALSTRANYDAPRSFYELGGWLANNEQAPPDEGGIPWYTGFLGRDAGGHQRQIYRFELAPWRAAELIWPNCGGLPFPTHRRWMSALGWEGSLWTPSLYVGLLPLGLAAVTWSLRRSALPETRWASSMVLLGSLASLGSCGLAWLIALPSGGSDAIGMGSEVGGLYWWMTVLLPGYVYFRYPAKLFVVATLGISLLAARGWDQTWQAGGRRLVGLWIALALLSLIGLAVLLVIWPSCETAFQQAPADPLLGPFDSRGAQHDIAYALLHTTVLAVALVALWTWAMRGHSRAGLAGALAVTLTALDLGIAQRGLLAYAPTEDWLDRPPLLDRLPADMAAYRVFRQLRIVPAQWQDASSSDRYAEALRWNRATLAPKFNLRYGISLAETSGTVVPHDYDLLLDMARQSPTNGSQPCLPAARVLDSIAARVAIVGADQSRGDVVGTFEPGTDMRLGMRASAQPRARISHTVAQLPSLQGTSPSRLATRTQEVFDTLLRADAPAAVVETDAPLDPPPRPAEEFASESCSITRETPTCIEVDATLANAGLLVLADQFYPGWEATVETDGRTRVAEILRTDRVLRGVLLPAGEHRVTFRYRPWRLALGGAISLATLAGLSAWMVALRLAERSAIKFES